MLIFLVLCWLWSVCSNRKNLIQWKRKLSIYPKNSRLFHWDTTDSAIIGRIFCNIMRASQGVRDKNAGEPPALRHWRPIFFLFNETFQETSLQILGSTAVGELSQTHLTKIKIKLEKFFIFSWHFYFHLYTSCSEGLH